MAVFRGCARGWDAYSKWNPFNTGLDYLEERAGSVEVEAMLSRTAPIFNGDIRSHERYHCHSRILSDPAAASRTKGNGSHVDAKSSTFLSPTPNFPMPEDHLDGQIYLAQDCKVRCTCG